MGSNSCGKIRIIAKIRAFTDVEAASGVLPEQWVSVHKPNGESSKKVKISFGDQLSSRKESYELDYCYEQDEDNSLIYSREIKPLISGVFDGCNVSVIAFGARGSGKTHTIQGSDETPGLAALTVAEILSMAEKAGKLISISSYEVYQDHVYDLLDPKRPEVMALEDARGKIQLKGLSQVPVNSISEFNKLFCNGNSLQKPQKTIAGLVRRSHKGLILHLLSPNENSDYLVSKMNFVDLAGYEDPRRKSNDRFSLVDIYRINKSIYALQNVIYALNANESHVPYRESKLSRMLQDSLVGTNQTIMISCLNPSFCQDTMYMVSLASRSCQGINRAFTNSTKKAKSSARSMVPLSGIGFTNKIKQNSSEVHFSAKKASGTTLEMMGRKLFEEGIHLGCPDQENTNSDVINESKVPAEEENTNSDVINDSTVPAEENASFSIAPRDMGATLVAENDITPHAEHNFLELVTPRIGVSSKPWTVFGEGHDLEKENKSLYMDEGGSPPISARLREISNNLKSLCSSTPLCLKLPLENRMSVHEQISDAVEPKTPNCERTLRAEENQEISNNSPDESFNMRSAGMKKSIVEEYVKFLNTASKDKLKEIKGIGEKRATYILALREESPEPFKDLDDLKDIGLSAKQIKGMMKKVAGDLFS